VLGSGSGSDMNIRKEMNGKVTKTMKKIENKQKLKERKR
jgi:hypothetical protein